MTSPFAPYTNATLVFQVSTGTLTTDTLGNVVPPKSKLTCTAVLKPTSSYKQPEKPAGVPIDAIYLEGNLVSPLSTSAAISPFHTLVQPGANCSATIDGKTGQFWLLPSPRNPYVVAVDVYIVDRLRGWFREGASVTITGAEYTAP